MIRGDIPQKSITATYMLNDDTGYIRIKNFGETTYPELLIALAKLSQEGFKSLVIDLRDNTGGYLQSAVQMANEFLPKNKLVVYTQGRKAQRQDYLSDGHGSYQKLPLVVLINEGSASASEIFAGAMQDNDRATIIGVRSAKDWFSSRWLSPTAVSSVSPSLGIIHLPEDVYKSPTQLETMPTMGKISTVVTSMGSSFHKTASNTRGQLITPALVGPFTAAAESHRIFSFPKTHSE